MEELEFQKTEFDSNCVLEFVAIMSAITTESPSGKLKERIISQELLAYVKPLLKLFRLSFTSISLVDCVHWMKLFDSLSILSNLTILEFSSCGLSSVVLASLCDLLTSLKSLESLNISSNPELISPVLPGSFSNLLNCFRVSPSLTELNLSGLNLSCPDLIHLFQYLLDPYSNYRLQKLILHCIPSFVLGNKSASLAERSQVRQVLKQLITKKPTIAIINQDWNPY